MPTGSSEAAAWSPLQRRLFEPATTVTLAELPARWFHQVVEVRCVGQARLVGDVRLPGWLRGAFGQALMRGASPAALADRPCTFEPPCALDAVFRSQGRLRRDVDLPPPFVIDVGTGGEDAVLRLTVFGFACDWIEAAADAFLAGIRSVAPAGQGFAPTARRIVTRNGVDPVPCSNRLMLEFRTPVDFRDPSGLAGDGRRLLMAMVRRVTALARYQDCAVEGAWGELARAAERVAPTAPSVRWVDWEQGSDRTHQRRPMQGQVGRVVLEGPLGPFLGVLALAETCHVGSHAALGQGAFRLILLERAGAGRSVKSGVGPG